MGRVSRREAIDALPAASRAGHPAAEHGSDSASTIPSPVVPGCLASVYDFLEGAPAHVAGRVALRLHCACICERPEVVPPGYRVTPRRRWARRHRQQVTISRFRHWRLRLGSCTQRSLCRRDGATRLRAYAGIKIGFGTLTLPAGLKQRAAKASIAICHKA